MSEAREHDHGEGTQADPIADAHEGVIQELTDLANRLDGWLDETSEEIYELAESLAEKYLPENHPLREALKPVSEERLQAIWRQLAGT